MKQIIAALFLSLLSQVTLAQTYSPEDTDPLRLAKINYWFCQFSFSSKDEVVRVLPDGGKIRSSTDIKVSSANCLMNVRESSDMTKAITWHGGPWQNMPLHIKYWHELVTTDKNGGSFTVTTIAEQDLAVPEGIKLHLVQNPGEEGVYHFQIPALEFPGKIYTSAMPGGMDQTIVITALNTKLFKKIPKSGYIVEGDVDFVRFNGYNNGTFTWLLEPFVDSSN